MSSKTENPSQRAAKELRNDDLVALYSQKVAVVEGEGDRAGGYLHVGVLIIRSSSIIFVEFDPAKKFPPWKRIFSCFCPVRGVITASHGKDPELLGFEKILEFPLSPDFFPLLSDSMTDQRIIHHFSRSYNLASNNCRDFAEAVIREATGLSDFNIDDELPYSFLDTNVTRVVV